MTAAPPRPTRALVIAGWLVHAYTASGLLFSAAVAILLLAPSPSAETVRWCFLLLAGAVVVDASDGTLARAVRIKQTIPGFDGRRLDDIVDFINYTCLPMLLLERTGVVDGYRWVLALVLPISAYGFCRIDAKTPDGSFLGFPSYWNIVAFYLYLIRPEPEISAALIGGLALLTFVPSRYPYPTMPGRLNRMMLWGCLVWSAMVAVVLFVPWQNADGNRTIPHVWAALSAVYPVTYLAVSWGRSLGRRCRLIQDRESVA